MTGAQNDILMIDNQCDDPWEPAQRHYAHNQLELGLPYTGTTTHVYGKGVNIYRQAPTPSLSGT